MKRTFLLFAIITLYICAQAQNISYTLHSYYVNNTIKTGLEVVKIQDTGTLTIPASATYNKTTYDVVSIGALAFNNCTALTKVTLPSTIRSIGKYAFTGCSVTSIDIPASVTTIEPRAFEAAKKLQSVRFAANSKLTTIPDHAFKDCTALTSVSFGANFPHS